MHTYMCAYMLCTHVYRPFLAFNRASQILTRGHTVPGGECVFLVSDAKHNELTGGKKVFKTVKSMRHRQGAKGINGLGGVQEFVVRPGGWEKRWGNEGVVILREEVDCGNQALVHIVEAANLKVTRPRALLKSEDAILDTEVFFLYGISKGPTKEHPN